MKFGAAISVFSIKDQQRHLKIKFKKMDCVFCKIVKGELPAYKIWEDDKHLAFLGIFPNTPGMSIVIPKEHKPSYLFKMEDQTYLDLMAAAKKVGLLLDEKLGTERTAMIGEGTEVEHAHVKLYPLWGFNSQKEKSHTPYEPKSYSQYPGWLTSQEGPRATDEELEKIYRKIIN